MACLRKSLTRLTETMDYMVSLTMVRCLAALRSAMIHDRAHAPRPLTGVQGLYGEVHSCHNDMRRPAF